MKPPLKAKGKKWFVIGAGGHARVVIATARACGLPNPEACLVDDGSEVGQHPIHGIPLLSTGSVRDQRGLFFPAVGDNQARRRLIREYRDAGWQPISLCHPGSLVEKGVMIGAGTIVALGAVIQAGAVLGDGVIVNTGAIIEHDVHVGDGVHIAPGSIILGEAVLGPGVLVGAGSRILPRVKVGEEAIIGAGSVVRDNVAAKTTVVGSPARVV
jgi:sugar O-acyltransferase (sialic acid O-acetyltransferase NeuD family)